MQKPGFRAMLVGRETAVNSVLSVGLDPLQEKIPKVVMAVCTSVADAVLLWMMRIVDATAPYALMYKPQHAHWSAIPGGLEALRTLIAYIHLKYPDIPVFMDCKRGDIDRTQQQYREAHFTLEGADGMNYNGYMGSDTLANLVDQNHLGRALVGLGRTSNPKAWAVQDRLLQDGRRVWEASVQDILDWSEEFGVINDAGVVMGAAHKDPNDPDKVYSQHLIRAREITGTRLWYLLPGIGAQEGFVKETILAAYQGRGTIAVGSSSAIDFASSGPDYAEAAGMVAMQTRDSLNQYIQ